MLKLPHINLKGKARVALLTLTALVTTIAPTAIITGQAFATAGPAPYNLRAYVGGTSIALLWNPVSGDTPTSYNVYRDGSLLANVAPSTMDIAGTAQRYLDFAITNGTSYSYQVSGLNSLGEESPLSTPLSVTQPATPFATPTITIDPSTPSAALPALQEGKTFLENWYPKFVTYFGAQSYASTSITLNTSTSVGYGAVTYYSTHTITANQQWAIDFASSPKNVDDLYAHEGTHILQNFNANVPSYVHEGLADYAKYYIYSDNIAPIPTGYTYLNGYERFGAMLRYIAVRSAPNIATDLQTMAHGATTGYDLNAFFKTQTGGLSMGEAWSYMTGEPISSILTLKNASANYCADVWGSGTTWGTATDMYTCNNSPAQQWTFIPTTRTTASPSTDGAIKTAVGTAGTNQCMDVVSSGTTNGTPVDMYTCNSSAAQKWVLQTNGSVMNPNSGKCLQPVSGGTALATHLEISTCTGAAIQNWGVRPIMQMMSQAATTTCVDSANGNTTLGWGWLNTCDLTADQQFTFVPTTFGSTTGYYKIYGDKCIDIASGGTADGTSIYIASCNNTAGQQWVRNSDGTLKNPASNKCLHPKLDTVAAGTYLELRTCGATNYYKWKFATM